jgi:hypothetical protein
MKGNNFWPEKIDASLEVWKSDRVLALVGDQAINSPGFSVTVIAFFGQLHPDISCAIRRGWCDICYDWPFVGLSGLIHATGRRKERTYRGNDII